MVVSCLCVSEPATIAASMAIDEPDAIDAAPEGPQQSGGWRTGGFVVSRGMTRRAALQRRKARVRGRNPTGRHCGIGDRGEAGFGHRSSHKRTCGSRAEHEQHRRLSHGWRALKANGELPGEKTLWPPGRRLSREIPKPTGPTAARPNCRRPG